MGSHKTKVSSDDACYTLLTNSLVLNMMSGFKYCN